MTRVTFKVVFGIRMCSIVLFKGYFILLYKYTFFIRLNIFILLLYHVNVVLNIHLQYDILCRGKVQERIKKNLKVQEK